MSTRRADWYSRADPTRRVNVEILVADLGADPARQPDAAAYGSRSAVRAYVLPKEPEPDPANTDRFPASSAPHH